MARIAILILMVAASTFGCSNLQHRSSIRAVDSEGWVFEDLEHFYICPEHKVSAWTHYEWPNFSMVGPPVIPLIPIPRFSYFSHSINLKVITSEKDDGSSDMYSCPVLNVNGKRSTAFDSTRSYTLCHYKFEVYEKRFSIDFELNDSACKIPTLNFDEIDNYWRYRMLYP